jgi:ArsR family transcriptional regulator, cadmium/lead-responsive transcriptional repressor
MTSNTYSLFFSNLANPIRIEIISNLKKKDMSVTELSKKTGIEQSKLSHALARLRLCNLVTVKSQGKKRIYSLNKKTLFPILDIIDEHSQSCCGGNCKNCSKC